MLLRPSALKPMLSTIDSTGGVSRTRMAGEKEALSSDPVSESERKALFSMDTLNFADALPSSKRAVQSPTIWFFASVMDDVGVNVNSLRVA